MKIGMRSNTQCFSHSYRQDKLAFGIGSGDNIVHISNNLLLILLCVNMLTSGCV